MSSVRVPQLSRRGMLAAGGALGLSALLSACGGGGDGGSDSAGGGWSFTDDRKKKATADSTPERVVAFTGVAAVLHDLGLEDRVVGVFGDVTGADGKPSPAAGDFDVSEVEIIGDAHGEFSVEKYAGLRPDLLVTHLFDGGMFYIPAESKEKILRVADAVCVESGRRTITEPIQRYVDLAEALGADLESKRVTDAKARFDKASERLRQVTKANRIKVMCVSAEADTFFVSNPEENADLIYFSELGVDFVVPDNPDEGGYFESLSWENSDKYEADLFLLDDRTVSLQPKDLRDKAGWRDLPAVKADQIGAWEAIPRMSWAGTAPSLERIATLVENAEKVS